MSNEKDQEDQGAGEKNRLTFIIMVRVGGNDGKIDGTLKLGSAEKERFL
jgi:hypothetical protein